MKRKSILALKHLCSEECYSGQMNEYNDYVQYPDHYLDLNVTVEYENWLNDIYRITDAENTLEMNPEDIDYNDPAWDLQELCWVSKHFTDEQFDILCQSIYYRTWAYA